MIIFDFDPVKKFLLEIPVKQILIYPTLFLISLSLFGQSEESIQFETFFQKAETLNSVPEEFQEQVHFSDIQQNSFKEEYSENALGLGPHSENESVLEKEKHSETEEKKDLENVPVIGYGDLENIQKNPRNKDFAKVKKSQGALSYRKENGAWGWYDYGDEENDGKYVGEIINMKPNGLGIFVYGKGKWKGDSYDGQWKDGEFHGKGTFSRTNGQRFFGEWKNSMLWNINGYDKFGRIIKKYRRGVKINTKKKDEEEKKISLQKRERGTLYREVPFSKWEQGGKKWMIEGDRRKHGIYEGEILNGVPDGVGEYTWYDVEKYVGEFRKGFFHGLGKMTFLSGITSVGVFKKNKEWETLHTKKTGEVTGKVERGRYYPM